MQEGIEYNESETKEFAETMLIMIYKYAEMLDFKLRPESTIFGLATAIGYSIGIMEKTKKELDNTKIVVPIQEDLEEFIEKGKELAKKEKGL